MDRKFLSVSANKEEQREMVISYRNSGFTLRKVHLWKWFNAQRFRCYFYFPGEMWINTWSPHNAPGIPEQWFSTRPACGPTEFIGMPPRTVCEGLITGHSPLKGAPWLTGLPRVVTTPESWIFEALCPTCRSLLMEPGFPRNYLFLL